MLIILSRHTVIFQSVAEVLLTGVAPLGAVSHRFFFYLLLLLLLVASLPSSQCVSLLTMRCRFRFPAHSEL